MKVTLDEEFIHSGKIYGPGAIDVKDEKIAQDLTESNDRVRKARGNATPVKPNGTMTSVTPDREPTASNGLTPDDLAKQHQEATNAALAAKQREDADKTAAAVARGQAPLNPAKAAVAAK